MNGLSISVTAAGEQLARRLPWPHVHGALAATVRSRWSTVDAFVLFAATGAATRIVGPLLADKGGDPVVVCVDEAGRWVVPLCGGHAGANDLAREVASLLDATAVVTTATDAMGLTALDTIEGCVATGDVAGVTRAMLDGLPVWLDNPRGWPLPDLPASAGRGSGPGIIVTDHVSNAPGVAVLHPHSLVVGVGASTGGAVRDLVFGALSAAGLAVASIGAMATIDRKMDEPAIVALAHELGVPLIGCAADVLSSVSVPNPSDVVAQAVGTPSVAEAAALAVAGPGATLLVTKQRSATATVAVARRAAPPGQLAVVGLGPGGAQHRTPAATAAVRHAHTVIGYGPYIDLVADLTAGRTIRSPIGHEPTRAKEALALATAGQRVALVCSGDAGVYAMASLVCELATEFPGVQVAVIPGVTAALAGAAALGAPLGHDHAAISLSDLLTPWPVITSRLEAAAAADLVVSLYNPRSTGRDWQLPAAIEIFRRHRPPDTPVGTVAHAGRAGERACVSTIEAFDPSVVDMSTIVIIGSSTTRVVDGRMVTPRGYAP